uniref:Fungal lipase-type domain-containing protein n=1 Tax=Amphora coffeiformis TaxID=265554 RepID=A0A6S8NQJ2_9STRA|mmetsp:Transcript_7779/g.14806  ORF Transcript_7779/g.14806 Transcript_7779/m.14806 type:complete len:806 (-) Transcript_7779:85-2502(-)
MKTFHGSTGAVLLVGVVASVWISVTEAFVSKTTTPQLWQPVRQSIPSLRAVEVESLDESFESKPSQSLKSKFGGFDLSTALFCGGLAFDAYVEPPSNSSRWEKGSQGLNVAFVSAAFARRLYKGVVEICVQKCTGLPEDESGAERLLTGAGVDACVLVAAVEGSWEEDVKLLEKEQFHEGVWDLSGAAHVGRTSTAWANVDERKSNQSKKQRGKASPYHIPGGWGRGGQAIWPEEEPFYLYVQDPSTVRLVFTVLDADRVGSGKPIGSTYKRLSDLIPQATLSGEDLIKSMKVELMEAAKKGEVDLMDDATKIRMGAKAWQGELKLTSKPRKRDKNSQIFAGAAAGAYVAGPMGAAAGALIGSLYEGQVQGSIHMKMRYLPIPQAPVRRKEYDVKGGMPGIEWGTLYRKYLSKADKDGPSGLDISDLEHCFFINHEKTGATCSVYRSLEKKLIVVSFRGTCAPVDLITDASLVQDAWVEGEEVENQDIPKVHNGFRTSLNSISRRLKELILATVEPGQSIEDYDMIVTGHSLGGALATLFTADIGQYGINGGRGLPQLEDSEPWWKGIANLVTGEVRKEETSLEPPRPKSLRMYNFGSPRVGNEAFADLFDALVAEGMIDQAYRVVNGEDVVARMPRTLNGLAFGQVRYEHVGTTVLVSQPNEEESSKMKPLLWIEGESDDSLCPVRDGIPLASQSGEGSLITELVEATRESWEKDTGSITGRLSAAMNQVTTRLQSVSAQDIASIVGIDRSFSEREIKLAQALLQGKALAHHMEDQYYGGMGRASGYLASVGEDIVELEKSEAV